jgi:conjugative transfer signal peptidase TraF
MMKRVLGVEGDMVSSGDEGIVVNGKLLPTSVPREADSAGRALSRYPFSSYILKDSELLLMSDVSGTSFDGRYFGPMNLSRIEGVVTPIILL